MGLEVLTGRERGVVAGNFFYLNVLLVYRGNLTQRFIVVLKVVCS